MKFKKNTLLNNIIFIMIYGVITKIEVFQVFMVYFELFSCVLY